jgi:flagellin-like hook-associated protein FlgL
MHNRIKSLEKLVADASALISRLKDENGVLKKQVELLGAARSKTVSGAAAARELSDFKAKVRRRLERICAKMEKADELQPGLFEEDDEQ